MFVMLLKMEPMNLPSQTLRTWIKVAHEEIVYTWVYIVRIFFFLISESRSQISERTTETRSLLF